MILVRQEVKYSKLKSVVLKVKIISVVLLLFCPFKVIKIMKAPLVFCNFFWGGGGCSGECWLFWGYYGYTCNATKGMEIL